MLRATGPTLGGDPKRVARPTRLRGRTIPSYGDLAVTVRGVPVFDALFDDPDALTQLEADALEVVWGGLGVRSVLDCAAGTGIQALGLAERGYEVAASDISPLMLEALREKAEARGVSVVTRRQDFRNLRAWEGRRFDAVVCGGGSITLVPTIEDVRRALRRMVQLVRTGAGVVVVGLHDYSHERDRAREFVLRRPYSKERNDFAFDVRLFDDEGVTVVHNLASWEGRWRITTSRKRHCYLSIAALRAAMEAAGCDSVKSLDLSGRDEVSVGEWALVVGFAGVERRPTLASDA
jgi:SAM-dependent methyltransferase